MLNISVVMITKNSEETIEASLKALSAFPEVIIADTGSQDKTLSIVQSFPNVRSIQIPFEGFGRTKNKATTFASYDWILSLDSDEILSQEALLELTNLQKNTNKVYSFPFHNYLFGKWIRGSGWFPDRHIRLFHRKTTLFSDNAVHEGIILDQVVEEKLEHPILHFSYRSMQHFLQKMDHYSTLFAQANHGKKKSSFSKALRHGLWAFIKSYFLQKGFLCGQEGFIIANYQSQTAFYKYMKLWEINKDL